MNILFIKKTFLIFFIQLVLCSFLFSQNEWNLEIEESGKCYYSFEIDSTTQYLDHLKVSNMVLELVEPIFEIEKRSMTKEELEQFKLGNKSIRVQTKPNATKYIFKSNKYLRKFSRQEETNGFVFCVIEVPGEYKMFTYEEAEKSDFIFDYQVQKQAPYIKKIKVDYLPLNLSENQFFVSEGNWTQPRELVAPSVCFPQTVRQIQCRLNDLGYSLEPNNIMSEATKTALKDFQLKNDLPVGQLDFETLKKLDLENLIYGYY